MKKTFAYFGALVATVLTLSSCLSDEETEYTYYGDTAISAFTLGTVNRYLTSTTDEGKDTTLSSTVTGSEYEFVIDQTQGLIYNTDSLPYGCDVSAVLATISSKNGGYVYIKSMTSDSLSYYSSSDSIDFSAPRVLRVYANDGSSYRDYTATVNVHQQKSGEMVWSQLASMPYDISDAAGLKTVAKGDSIFLLESAQGTTVVYLYDGANWIMCMPNLNTPLAATAYKSGLAWGGQLYIASNGTVLRSTDGTNWEAVATETAITQLVGAGTTEIYGLTGTGIVASKDGGATWTDETLADDASLLPTDDLSFTCKQLKTNEQMERVMIVGSQTGETYAKAWTKLVDYSDDPVATKWNFVDVAGDNQFALTVSNNLSVIAYNGLALGFGFNDGVPTTIYQSVDDGITWKSTSDYSLPTLSGAQIVATAVDKKNYIWVIGSNGLVWRGRLNDLGW